jgi:hypothetical protein
MISVNYDNEDSFFWSIRDILVLYDLPSITDLQANLAIENQLEKTCKKGGLKNSGWKDSRMMPLLRLLKKNTSADLSFWGADLSNWGAELSWYRNVSHRCQSVLVPICGGAEVSIDHLHDLVIWKWFKNVYISFDLKCICSSGFRGGVRGVRGVRPPPFGTKTIRHPK